MTTRHYRPESTGAQRPESLDRIIRDLRALYKVAFHLNAASRHLVCALSAAVAVFQPMIRRVA